MVSYIFQDRADSRDRRPLEYPLRLAFPLTEDKEQKSKGPSIWCKSYLFVNNRTCNRAAMLQSKDMKVLEEDDGTLCSLSPAEKYSQVGQGAWFALVESALQNLPSEGRLVVIVDLSPKLGDLPRALLQIQEGSMPMHYIALGPQSQTEWARDDLEDAMVDMFLGRTLKIKGHEPLPENMSAAESPELAKPTLSVGSVDGPNLILPGSLASKWSSSSFKDEWQALLAEVSTALPPLEDDGVVKQPDAKRMRLESGPDAEPGPDHPTLVDASQLEVTQMLLQVAAVGKLKGLTFQLFPGNMLYLLNSSATDVPACGFLTGWQKGKWCQEEVGIPLDPCVDIVFKFASSDDFVVLENTCQTLYSIMEKQKQTAPEKAILRYHKMKEYPEGRHGPGDFTVEVLNEVAWKAERVTVAVSPGSKQNPATLAALLPADCWDPCSCAVTWQVRWAKQGLTGIKPVVHLKRAVVIPPNQALRLTLPA